MEFPAFQRDCVDMPCVNQMEFKKREKGICTVLNLGVICPRHIGFGLANTRVASS